MSKLNKLRVSLAVFTAFILTSCATLLMLPDELPESHYRSMAGDIGPQIKSKATFSPGGKLPGEKEGLTKKVMVLPIVYIYDTNNTLKENEEAYYTSIFNNSSGSWLRPFALSANNTIRDILKSKGYEPTLFGNADLQRMGATPVFNHMGKLANTQYKAVAYNAESQDTNLAVTNFYDFRKFIGDKNQGVVFMKIIADWEPSSANRLNSDIVLNTTVTFGYEFVLCGVDNGCSTVSVPFEKGITTNLFMPNRNSIDDAGRDKNYTLLSELHNAQLALVIKHAFEKIEGFK